MPKGSQNRPCVVRDSTTPSGHPPCRIRRGPPLGGERIKASGLIALGGKGYVGLSEVVLRPLKGRDKPWWKKQADSEHAKLRSPELYSSFSSEKQEEIRPVPRRYDTVWRARGPRGQGARAAAVA